MRALTFFALLPLLAGCSGSYAPDDLALEALESSDGITVTEADVITFSPEGAPTTGFIFYPGGKVEPEAYAPPVRRVAEAGHLAVIVPMPMDLAIFGAGRGADVIEAHPEIQTWVIGGHSLGGVAAADFAYSNPETIAGLALWASYPQDKHDLSASAQLVASVYGTQDCVATPEEVLAAAPLLPDDTLWVPIEGGNHGQFGSYGFQEGDCEARITPEAQHSQAAAVVVGLLEAAAHRDAH